MHSFRNAKWSWPITVIPVWIFLWIHYGTYEIIREQLSPENSSLWLWYGSILFLLWIFHTAISICFVLAGSQLEKRYGYVTFWTYVLFVFLYLSNFYSMMPPSMPGWVASENKRLYSLIFIAPTLLHSLAIISIDKNEEVKRITREKFIVIGVSLVASILLLILHPLTRPGIEHKFGILMFLLSSSAFLHGIIKAFNVNRIKTFFIRDKYIAVAKPILALAFPLTVMFLNNDILFDVGAGNFSDSSFYGWCIVNALAICAPDFKQKTYRIVIFFIRSATYSYIIWLMITFMPHLPLSAISVSSFGLGYLMATPLIIIILHTKLLVSDSSYLYHHLPRQTIRVMFASGASLPIIINTFSTLYA